MSQNVSVAVRLRPLSGKERLTGCSECIHITENSRIFATPDKFFVFDHALGSETNQSFVFKETVLPILENFLQGYNATILAYGQTGSGKTYTMGTSHISDCDEEQLAIIPRSFKYIYDSLSQRYEFELYASFLEIYNEEVIDLLSPTSVRSVSSRNILTVREDANGSIFVAGITEEKINNYVHLISILHKGSLCRTTKSTDMNVVSSRSHAVLTLLLRQQPDSSSEKRYVSKIHFVDLAGSERLKRTNAEGDRVKESISINSGLLALGNVISALGDESKRGQHVPYRDSKLTRLLQDSLGGNSRTLMIACVSPSNDDYNESLNTLRYANRARNIRNNMSLTEDIVDGSSAFEVIQLRKQISSLKQELLDLKNGNFMKKCEKPLDNNSYELQRKCELLEREKLSLEKELEAYKSMSGRGNEGMKEAIRSQAQTISELRNRLGDSSNKRFSRSERHLASPSKNIPASPTQAWANNVRQFVASAKEKLSSRLSIVRSVEDLAKIDSDEQEQQNKESIVSELAVQVENMIAPIRSDLALKSDLLQKIEQGQREYVLLRQKYEERFGLVQKNLQQIQNERDDALTKLIQYHGKILGEPNKYSRQKYEDRIKVLAKENKDFKEQLDVLNRNLGGKNTTNENIIRNLRTSMAALKEEKQRLQHLVDRESYKSKSTASTSDKEIADLRAKERKALETAKKWKKAYDFEKTLLQRRVEQFMAAKAKIRVLLNALRKKHVSLGSPSIGIDLNSPGWRKINSPGDSGSNSPLLSRSMDVRPSPLHKDILAQLQSAASLAKSNSTEDTMMEIDE